MPTFDCCEHCPCKAKGFPVDAHPAGCWYGCNDATPPVDEPIPYVLVEDPEERRRLSTKASDGQTCMIYRGGVA